MTIVSGIVVFKVIWWITFLALLPVGVIIDNTPQRGTATSAPTNPNIWQKALWTTLITAILWGLVFLVITKGWIHLAPYT